MPRSKVNDFLYRAYKVGFEGSLIGSEVPESYRKLREACRKIFRNASSKSEFLLPSYDKQTVCLLSDSFLFPVLFDAAAQT